MNREYDVIVVGAGVEGSSTAYNLVKNGGAGRVLLLEQFSALHTRGSSHGGSRITRRAYTKPYYIKMMDEAYKMWDQVERESHSRLYIKTGLLMFGPKKSECLQSIIKCLAESGLPHDRLSAQQVMSKYPQFQLPQDHEGVFEKDGGLLMATKAVGTLQRLFTESGGELLEGHKVTEMVPGHIVTVHTNQGAFTTKKLVITAGAWAPAIMASLGVHLPFKVARTEVLYWKADEPKHFSWENFPAFIQYADSDDLYNHIYGLPIHEYPGLVKICFHSTHCVVDPDARDNMPGPMTAHLVRRVIESLLKGVATTPSICEACMYTESPDEDPVLDKHPLYPNIIMGAGFSGHGFKLAPVVGKILTELTLDLPHFYNLTPFRLDRFAWQSPAKL